MSIKGHHPSRIADRMLSHWLLALPILLAVAALGARHSDLYAPAMDEFYSMQNAGWAGDGAFSSTFSPGEVLQSLRRNSPNHSPLYFLILGLWGQLTVPDIMLARLLSILFALLGLSLVFRLARDFVGPAAGTIALILASSNAFYNYYIAYARMYTLLVFLSALVLWLYLRIVDKGAGAKKRDFLALGAAVYCLANTFLFSAAFLLALGLYHLIAVSKNRNWLKISATVIVALLFFSPWLLAVLPDAYQRSIVFSNWENLSGTEALAAWLTVSLNAEILLLFLSIFGLLLGRLLKTIRLKPWLFMFLPYLLLLALIANYTTFIAEDAMRYHLSGLIPLLLTIVAGLYALYRIHWTLALLVLLWPIAGLQFQRTAPWDDILGGQIYSYLREPIHLISREALQEEQPPLLVGYRTDSWALYWKYHSDSDSLGDLYFDQRNLELITPDGIEDLEKDLRHHAIEEPYVWVFYLDRRLGAADRDQLATVMKKLNYQLCDSRAIGIGSTLDSFSWDALNCAPPHMQSRHQNAFIHYQFFGAEVNSDQGRIAYIDRWSSDEAEATSSLNMSMQLISEDWNNVAQVDLPMVKPDQLRQFTIDISNAPPGRYRLMTIVYDNQTGARSAWLNNGGEVGEMLELAVVNLP
ncbi:MAG: glycosyltransferase family 39 protein [Chloroflexota bacterium]|nr:glycosyltransferase family 39 protein [Chloroflexota bacterium]